MCRGLTVLLDSKNQNKALPRRFAKMGCSGCCGFIATFIYFYAVAITAGPYQRNHLGEFKLCYLNLSFGTFSCNLLIIISVYCH